MPTETPSSPTNNSPDTCRSLPLVTHPTAGNGTGKSTSQPCAGINCCLRREICWHMQGDPWLFSTPERLLFSTFCFTTHSSRLLGMDYTWHVPVSANADPATASRSRAAKSGDVLRAADMAPRLEPAVQKEGRIRSKRHALTPFVERPIRSPLLPHRLFPGGPWNNS